MIADQLCRIKAIILAEGWVLPGVNNAAGYPMFNSGIGIQEAILQVCQATKTGRDVVRRISLTVAPNGRGTSLEIVEWEERYGRKQADVLAALDAAIGGGDAVPDPRPRRDYRLGHGFGIAVRADARRHRG